MNMYNEFSNVYDIVFPIKDKTLAFISDEFKTNKRLMDVGCATGAYAMALADLGHEVTGIDLDKAMIALANRKKGSDQNPIFIRQDMTTIDHKTMYDGIYCIGNTLVHLENEEQINAMISLWYRTLKPKGKVLIQIINYDRVVSQHITSLDTIKNDDIVFERHYSHEKGRIRFKTRLITPDQKIDDHVMLVPLRVSILKSFLVKEGFEQIELYGGFNRDNFDIDHSIQLVMTAEKR